MDTKLLRAGKVRGPRIGWVMSFAALMIGAGRAELHSQLPGTPVLQNAWATPGLSAAVNVGGGADGATYAGALAWAPRTSRFQLSGGGGVQSTKSDGSRGVYGVRLAVPFGGAASSIGFAGFAGIGGGTNGKKTNTLPNDSLASTSEVPLGVAVGWRHSVGADHGFSVYAAPAFVLFSGGTKSDGLFRASVGADAGITRALGVTLGVEFGGTRARGLGGPSGSLYAVGVSYSFGHR